MKKNGGTIDNWQVHTLSLKPEDIEKVYPGKCLKPIVFTGTIVNQGNGKFSIGHHMRSSLIVNIDRERGIIETKNTIYNVLNEGGDGVSDSLAQLLGKETSDLGDDVMKITY